MAAGAVLTDITVFAYEDWPLQFTIKDEDGVTKNLTGATATWVLKRGPGGAEILRKTTVAGITNGGAAGTLTVDVTETDTQALGAGLYYHEMLITLGGVTRKSAYGAVVVRATGIRS